MTFKHISLLAINLSTYSINTVFKSLKIQKILTLNIIKNVKLICTDKFYNLNV